MIGTMYTGNQKCSDAIAMDNVVKTISMHKRIKCQHVLSYVHSYIDS